MNVEVLDMASPELRRIAAELERPVLLMQAAGRRVEKDLKAHFRSRNDEGNEQGWVRSHWWNREVAKATAYQGATNTDATVSIASRQFLHKLRGGTVRAANGKFLALPMTNEAKAKGSPGEWTSKGDGKLQFVRSREGRAYLFPGEGEAHGAAYILLKSVTHKADPRALPPQADLDAAVGDEARRFLTRILRRATA
jgi:hypothetical protein